MTAPQTSVQRVGRTWMGVVGVPDKDQSMKGEVLPVIPGCVVLDEATVAAASGVALREGLAGMSIRLASAVLAMLIFPERVGSERSAVQGEIHDLVADIVDLAAGAHNPQHAFRRTLKATLDDLRYLATAFQPGRRPRATRCIGADTLTVLTGSLPPSLQPPAGGTDVSDFGQLLIGELDLPQTGLIATSRNSPLLGASLALAGSERPAAIWSRSLSHWPQSLRALGLDVRAHPQAPVCSGRIRRLSEAQKQEIAELASAAEQWLKTVFGIDAARDALRFSPEGLVTARASARIVNVLAEMTCPAPEAGSARSILTRIREPHPRAFEACNTMQGSAYQLLFDLVKNQTMQRVVCGEGGFAARADAIGLIDAEKRPDTFDRYVENHVRTLVHQRMIDQARVYLEKSFAGTGVDVGDFDASSADHAGFSPRDFHALGAWSEDLKIRLETGMVDRSHGRAVRFRRSAGSRWVFPSKLPADTTVEELTQRLVKASRAGDADEPGRGLPVRRPRRSRQSKA